VTSAKAVIAGARANACTNLSGISARLRLTLAFAGAGFGAIAGAGSAYAQETLPAPPVAAVSVTENVYGPDFYARFAPRSALDMIQQTPGFTITEVVAGKRGLGQGGANVLINSQRISSKATSAADALNRISADRVVRVEIVDGARLNIPGLSGYVANIITHGGAMTGRLEWAPEFREDRKPKFERGKAFVSGDIAGWNYTASLMSDQYGDVYAGTEYAYNEDVELFDVRVEDDENWNTKREASLDLSNETLSGMITNLRVLASSDDKRQREFSDRTGINLPDRFRVFQKMDDGDKIELGGDFEFGLGPGRLKLIGLHQTLKNGLYESAVTDFLGARPTVGSQVITAKESGESILRSEYSLQVDNTDWQASLEGAFNFLDSAAELSTISNGNYVVVPLAGSTSRVEERRAEATLVHGRPLTDQLSVQASLGVEYSELSQTGANGQVREFVRPKGFVALSYNPGSVWDATFRVERAVGQLDFANFVTVIGLNSDQSQTTAGNPNIVPEQSWDTELIVNSQMAWSGPVKLRLFYRAIEDVNDQILVSRIVNPNGSIDILESEGNLDSAVDYGIELSGTYPLGSFLPGAKIDWLYLLSEQRVEDPVVPNLTRMLNRIDFGKIDVKFRQDIPGTPWAWGAEFFLARGSGQWRLDQRTHRISRPGNLDMYVQNKDLFGLDVNIRLLNLLDEEDDISRLIWNGTRADMLELQENRLRYSGRAVRVTVSGSF
jgi:outer membrane receptor for ferrienterochelin and colicins